MAAGDSGQSRSGGERFRTMLPWYAIGLLIGAVRLVVGGILPAGSAGLLVPSIVLALAMVLLLVWAGWTARRSKLRPSWQAALVGVWYGVPAGLTNVLFPLTPAQVAARLAKAQPRLHLTAAQLQLAQQGADSVASHWEGFAETIILYALLGLLLGWLGALFAPGTPGSRAV